MQCDWSLQQEELGQRYQGRSDHRETGTRQAASRGGGGDLRRHGGRQPWASSLQNSQKEMSVAQVTQLMAFHCGGLVK